MGGRAPVDGSCSWEGPFFPRDSNRVREKRRGSLCGGSFVEGGSGSARCESFDGRGTDAPGPGFGKRGARGWERARGRIRAWRFTRRAGWGVWFVSAYFLRDLPFATRAAVERSDFFCGIWDAVGGGEGRGDAECRIGFMDGWPKPLLYTYTHKTRGRTVRSQSSAGPEAPKRCGRCERGPVPPRPSRDTRPRIDPVHARIRLPGRLYFSQCTRGPLSKRMIGNRRIMDSAPPESFLPH